MGAKTISLSEEAYDRLQRRKREGESFNDVVNRLAGERPLLDIVGTGRADDGVETAIEDASENLDESTERLAAKLNRGRRSDAVFEKKNLSTLQFSVSCYHPWHEYAYPNK